MFKARTLFLTLCFLLASQTLSAFYIGPDREAFSKGDVIWRPIKYDDDDCGLIVAFPGNPECGIDKTFVYAVSKFKKTSYAFLAEFTTRYSCPHTEKAFIRQIESAFKKDKVKITAIPSNQKTVRYIVEVEYLKKDDLIRIYCSCNQLYWFSVYGKDRSLVPDFFDSIQITK